MWAVRIPSNAGGRPGKSGGRTSGEDVDFSMNTAPLMRHTKSTWSVALSHTLRLFHGTVTVIIVVASLVAMQAK